MFYATVIREITRFMSENVMQFVEDTNVVLLLKSWIIVNFSVTIIPIFQCIFTVLGFITIFPLPFLKLDPKVG